MNKTITITDPMQVQVGDKAFFKDCDFGFTVSLVDKDDTNKPFTVVIPFSESVCWALSSQFDHATREINEPEQPDPHDFSFHIYIGSDGNQYIYEPCVKHDPELWTTEVYGTYRFFSRNDMEAEHRDALPLTELKLVTKEEES